MAAVDYVRLALRGVLRESEIGVVQSIQVRLRGALDSYVDPAWAPEGWVRLADLAAGAMRSTEPGSDFQLAWARTLAGAARSSDHVKLLRGLLDGSESVPGLQVDTDLGWTFLQSPVALGAAGDREIDLELERDNTASGQRRWTTALRPTAEAKAEAWRLATTDVELPNAIIESIVRGFYHPAQHTLTQGYLSRYCESIASIWEQRPGEIGRMLVVGLYPGAISAAALATANAFPYQRCVAARTAAPGLGESR